MDKQKIRARLHTLGTSGLPALVAGPAAAQFIPLATMPIIARIYSPDAMGVYTFFGTIAGVVGIVATGRYHLAQPLAQSDRQATAVNAQARRLTMLATIAIAAPIGMAVAFGASTWAEKLMWAVGLPMAVHMAASSDTLTYWALRFRNEKVIAKASLGRATSSQIGQIGAGVAGPYGPSMVAGMLLGQIVGNHMLRKSPRPDKVTTTERKRAARHFADYPRHEMSSHAAFSVTSLGLPMAIGFLYGPAVLGLYAVSTRVLVLPSIVLGTAVGQYLLREVSRRRLRDRKRLVQKTVALLLLTVTPVGPVLWVYGNQAFTWVLGAEWADASKIALYLWPMIWLRLGSSACNSVYASAGRQKELMQLQVGLAFVVAITVLLAGALNWEASILLKSVSLAASVFSVIIILRAFALAGRTRGDR